GGREAFRRLLIPVFFFSVIVGGLSFFSSAGSGKDLLYDLAAMIMLVSIVIIVSIARATAGSISNILFLLVAVTGSLFSNSVGGDLGAVIMAISCALISKRALSGARGFGTLRRVVAFFTSKLGTSFRNCILSGADFSLSKTIHN